MEGLGSFLFQDPHLVLLVGDLLHAGFSQAQGVFLSGKTRWPEDSPVAGGNKSNAAVSFASASFTVRDNANCYL